MKSCCNCCVANNVSCPVGNLDSDHPNGCKYWIDYEDDLNCSLIAIEKHGPMTLREISDRLYYTIPRIKQIQDECLNKIEIVFNKETV
tara:strand:- start:2171 stop:2434 length:264 start_codon:yes stop_codon:yes gene_type:complete